MFNKYKKYIYSFIIFYVIWLVGIPLGFKLLAQPCIDMLKLNYGLNITVDSPRIVTSILPNVKIKANKICINDNKNNPSLSLDNPNLSIRILPIISGKIHINSFESKNIKVNGVLKDKLYFADIPITLNNKIKDIKNFKIKRVKIGIFEAIINEPLKKNIYKISGENLYFKTTRNSFNVHGSCSSSVNGNISTEKFDIRLPKSKNLKKTKFNIDITNLDLKPFGDIINRCLTDDIVGLNGVVNLHSDNKKMSVRLKNIKILFKDNTKSVIFPEIFNISTKYRIGENSFYIKQYLAEGKGIKSEGKGIIKDIFSLTPDINMSVKLEDTDIRVGALMLPPIITPDINIPKLKQYPFYGNISGDFKIKGKFPEPDMFGNIKVTDGILIKPIPNATGNANINIELIGKQLLLDVVVPAGGKEIVYVSGDIMLYGDKYAHLRVRSSNSVDLATAEFVVNPLHEILCFQVGPVPIMDVRGHGNIDIKIVGTKKDPHIWGDFNFKNTSARFLEVNNLKLEHADGNLNFNNQIAHFINNTGTMHGQKATVEGTCTLFGDLDFEAKTNNQNLSDLVTILTTSPMLKDTAKIIPKIYDIKGKSDFYLHLKGKLLDINDLKINENVVPSGFIKLLGNSVKYENLPINNIIGIINYNKTDCDINLSASISSGAKSKIAGSIKKEIADIKINCPRLKVNDLDPVNFKLLDPLYISMNAHYKGDAKDIELGGIDADINLLRDNRPVKNAKITSGKIRLKNSNLSISGLNGYIKKNPFNLTVNAANLGAKKLNLKSARVNGRFNCKDLDLTSLNVIKKLNILPNDLQKEINKLEIKSGKATINAIARFSRINAGVNIKDILMNYTVTQGKEKLILPLNIKSGQINIKNNTLNLCKINGKVDEMPVFIFGKVDNIFRNPEYNIRINSKLVQKVFDKYWNANNIYPVKMNGDIICSTGLSGNQNKIKIKTDMKMEANSNIYYMGATIGDNLNPITVNLDMDLDKSGWININQFRYNKLISSQNNKGNELPMLIINGKIKPHGKLYLLKNLVVKTDNPANANFFNIIFKKPTIKSGNFTSDLKINGISNKPIIIGKFYAKNMEMPYLNTSIKDLLLNFKQDNIQLTTKGTVLDNYIMINSTIKNNLTPPYKISSADIYINEFDIDNSLNQLKQMELKGFSSAIAPNTDAVGNELMHSVLFNNMKIRAGKIKVKNINASNLEAICSLNEKMRVAVDSFKFNMASGIISGKLDYNLLNNFTQMELNSKGVNANELCIALFDLPNQIYGSLTGHIELSCNATDDKTRLSTLNGFGNFSVDKGKMPKLGSMEYLLRAGNLIKGGITGLTMNGIIDIIAPMKTGEFSKIDGRIRLKDGVAKTLEIRTLGKNLSLYVIGSLNLSTQVADMHVYGQLSKTVSTILGTAGNISLNTLFNKIPGVSLDKNSAIVNDINKIPGIELSNRLNRRFMVEILGDISGDSFVKSFKWIN